MINAHTSRDLYNLAPVPFEDKSWGWLKRWSRTPRRKVDFRAVMMLLESANISKKLASERVLHGGIKLNRKIVLYYMKDVMSFI